MEGGLLKTFFHSVVMSAIFYDVVCWNSSLSTAERKRLEKLIMKASAAFGCPLDPVQVEGNRRTLVKITPLLFAQFFHFLFLIIFYIFNNLITAHYFFYYAVNCFFFNLHAPSACHFAAGTLEFPQLLTIRDISILYFYSNPTEEGQSRHEH